MRHHMRLVSGENLDIDIVHTDSSEIYAYRSRSQEPAARAVHTMRAPTALRTIQI